MPTSRPSPPPSPEGRCPALRRYRFDSALGENGWVSPAVLEVAGDGRIRAVRGGAAATGPVADGAVEVGGHALPGMPNLHSHAFQWAVAGHGECRDPSRPEDSFWSWRETMYRVAGSLDAEGVEAVAERVFLEMLRGGYTSVGEFHYLHHRPDGSPHTPPEELGARVLAAAARVGIRCTLLPVLYRHGGLDPAAAPPHRPLGERQRRFGFEDPARFVDLVAALRRAAGPFARVGAAVHSLRAVDPGAFRELVSGVTALDPDAPLHVHAAEQDAEVAAVAAVLGAPPVRWLLEHAPLDRRWCVVHATHMDEAECADLAASGAVAGLCPTTEASLGDGIFPAVAYLAAGGAFGIGSDSQIRVDAMEELRLLEWGQRLLHRRRNLLADPAARPSTGERLWRGALAGGARALGEGEGPVGLVPGASADLLVLDPDAERFAGHDAESRLDALVFAAGPGAIRDVMVGGSWRLRGGRHAAQDRIESAARAAIRRALG